MESKGVEKALVKNWQGWDIINTDCFAFYDVELQPDLAEYVGVNFAPVISIDLLKMVATVYKKDGAEVKVNLLMSWSK